MSNLTAGVIWLRRIADLALVGLIVVVLVAIAVGKIVPLLGRQSIIIGGSSMEPAIHLGSAVVISPVAASDLGVGDVVSLQVGEAKTVFTHRIVAIVDRPDGRWIRTKGDANSDPDPELVPASAVIGRVDVTIPAVGYLMALLSLPVGVLFVIGLAATLLAIAWLLESLEPPRMVRVRLPSPDAAGGGVPARPLATHDLVARSLASALAGPGPQLVPSAGSPLQLVAAASRTELALMADPFAVAEAEAAAEARLVKRRRDRSTRPRSTAPDQAARTRDLRTERARSQLRTGDDRPLGRRRGSVG